MKVRHGRESRQCISEDEWSEDESPKLHVRQSANCTSSVDRQDEGRGQSSVDPMSVVPSGSSSSGITWHHEAMSTPSSFETRESFGIKLRRLEKEGIFETRGNSPGLLNTSIRIRRSMKRKETRQRELSFLLRGMSNMAIASNQPMISPREAFINYISITNDAYMKLNELDINGKSVWDDPELFTKMSTLIP